MKYQLTKDTRGVAALLTVIIIGAATLLIAYTASVIGLEQIEQGFVSSKSLEAGSLSDGCLDETLRRIRYNTSHGLLTSPISLSLGNGSCIIDVSDLGGNQRRITVTGTVTDYSQKIEAVITLTGNAITMNSWTILDN